MAGRLSCGRVISVTLTLLPRCWCTPAWAPRYLIRYYSTHCIMLTRIVYAGSYNYTRYFITIIIHEWCHSLLHMNNCWAGWKIRRFTGQERVSKSLLLSQPYQFQRNSLNFEETLRLPALPSASCVYLWCPLCVSDLFFSSSVMYSCTRTC